MKFLNTTGNSIEMIDGDVVLNLPFNALYTHIVNDNVSFLINYPEDVWDYDSLKQYRRVRPEYKYGDALMSANADQLNVNGNVYDIETLKTLLPTLINKSGGGGDCPDQSDATITASDVMSGKIGYNDYNKVTGNIESVNGSTVTPTTTDVVLNITNKYMLGDVTIKGDADLKPENIKKDVDLFGIKGIYESAGTYTEESYKINGYDYVLGEGNALDFMRIKSHEITKDWTVYDTYGQTGKTTTQLMYFIPNLPVTVKNGYYMFKGCINLLQIPPEFNTSEMESMQYMFSGCTSLLKIENLNLEGLKYNINYNFSYVFSDCKNLISASFINTQNINTTISLFSNCSSLKNILKFDTSNVTNMQSMFSGCTALQTIPQLETSNVTNMQSMFNGCTALQTIPQLETSNVTNMQSMFKGCANLTSLPKLDFSSILTSMTYNNAFFDANSNPSNTYSYYLNLTDLGGFTGIKISFWLNGCQSLTEQSIINVFNEMADLSATTSQTVHLGSVNIAKCSPETLAIATDKNWIIT